MCLYVTEYKSDDLIAPKLCDLILLIVDKTLFIFYTKLDMFNFDLKQLAFFSIKL